MFKEIYANVLEYWQVNKLLYVCDRNDQVWEIIYFHFSNRWPVGIMNATKIVYKLYNVKCMTFHLFELKLRRKFTGHKHS